MISHKSMKEAQVNALFGFLDMFSTKQQFLDHCKDKGKNPNQWLPLWERRQSDLLNIELEERNVTARQAWNQLIMSKQKPSNKGF